MNGKTTQNSLLRTAGHGFRGCKSEGLRWKPGHLFVLTAESGFGEGFSQFDLHPVTMRRRHFSASWGVEANPFSTHQAKNSCPLTFPVSQPFDSVVFQGTGGEFLHIVLLMTGEAAAVFVRYRIQRTGERGNRLHGIRPAAGRPIFNGRSDETSILDEPVHGTANFPDAQHRGHYPRGM